MASIQEAREYLEQVGVAKNKCIQCDCMLEEIRNTRITTGFERGYELNEKTQHTESFTRLKEAGGRNGTNSDLSDFIVQLETEEAELEDAKNKWLHKRVEIRQFLNGLDMDEGIKTVLILRYISLKSWREISDVMGKSPTWLRNLEFKGLKIVAKKI